MRHCTQCGAGTPDDARFCPRCGAPVIAAAAGDPMLGKTIAERYHLVEKIGQGGSGTIYRGEHTTLKKRVAVKVLHAQLSTDDTALERFRREATTVAGLDNDHILQVIDFGRTDDNRLFFAMELLEGEPLTKVIERDKQLSIDRAVDILVQTCEGLIEAHGLGYIHRDLRPRNIFLTNRRGRADFVKLLDFGLAKLILPDAEAKQTAMGMTFGDPRYMSPEQARGETLDRRSDIYSLGAIAFEMLTGTPPYTGSGTFEILQQHLDAPVPKVRERRAECPQWLDAAVQRALAKKPDGRFATVANMLESLRGHAAPAAADAAEKAEHAKLSKDRPPVATVAAPAPQPPPVQSMGPSVTLPPTANVRAPSAKETQALTTLAPRPRPEPKPEPKKTPAPAAASGSVEVTPSKIPDTINVPSVVVEGSSNEKTAPAVPARLQSVDGKPPVFEDRPTTERSAAAPLPPPPPVETTSRRKADPTGEWFSSDSQPVPIVKGAPVYDDLDEIPRTNRGPIIIGAVSGGLILVGAIVIALLPKAEHKPLRGETPEPAKVAQAEAPSGASAQPSGASAQPSGASAQPSGASAQMSGASAQPSGTSAQPSGTSAQPSGTSAQPSGVAVAPSTPPPVAKAAPTTGEPAKPVTPPPAVAVAPSPSPKPMVAPPPPSAVAEKPIAKPATSPTTPAPAAAKPAPAVVAKAPPPVEKPAPKEPAAHADKVKPAPEKPTRVASAAAAAPVERRKKDKSADGFKDPFAADAPKATAPSAGESAQAEFFVKLGRQKLSSSDLTAAAASFNKAREYDAKSSEAVAGLGEVAFEQGDYNGAAVHLKQALRLAPNRTRYLVLLGQAYYKLGKPKDAAVEYKKALRIDPSNQEAQHSLEVAERKLQSGG